MQTTLYLQGNSDWNAANGWNTAANGSGTAVTNPQNGGGTTYRCVLNGKTLTLNAVDVLVDEITNAATGGTAGGTINVTASRSIEATLRIESTAVAQPLLRVNTAGITVAVNGNWSGSAGYNFQVDQGTLNITGNGSRCNIGILAYGGVVNYTGSMYCTPAAASGATFISISGGTFNWKNQVASIPAGNHFYGTGYGPIDLTGLTIENYGRFALMATWGMNPTVNGARIKQMSPSAQAALVYSDAALQIIPFRRRFVGGHILGA